MSLDKLKDTARKFEQKEDWRKAIEVYLKAIQQLESGKDASPDLSLLNRVGDLYLKVNDTASAVRHYERAVDLYADQGFFNNAIALCGKILRVNPGRTLTYLRLAQLHARKNVVIEAKRNLLEYIERMHAQGNLDEAFAAVKAFADQFSSSQDIRLMLIELLRAASRSEEVREQLEKLSFDLETRDEHPAARQAAAPEAQHAKDVTDAAAAPRRGGDLVFLDTGFGVPSPTPRSGTLRSGERPAIDPAVPDGLLVSEALQVDPPAPKVVDAEPYLPMAQPGDGELTVTRIDGIELPPAVEPEPSVPEIGGFEATVFDTGSDHAASQPGSGNFDGYLVEQPPSTGELAASDELGELERLENVEFGGGGLRGGDENAAGLDDAPLEILEPDPLAMPDPEVDLSDVLAESLAEPDPEPIVEFSESDTIELEFIDDGTGAASLEAASEPGDSGLTFLDPPPTDEPAEPAAELTAAAAPVVVPPAAAPSAPPDELAELQQAVIDRPDDPETHRNLGALLLRRGELAQALVEFQIAAEAYETQEAWDAATGAVEQVVALEPDDMRHYQKLVELAFRSGSRSRLIDAYLRLADALTRLGAQDKAHAVYNRVLDHDPTNPRALAGIQAAVPPSEEPPVPVRQTAPAMPPRPAAPPTAAPAPTAAAGGNSFVDLGSLILDEQAPKDTRMRVEGRQPIEDEQRAFEETLAEFKRGIEQNLAADDYQAHYDLGIAFKEMGLLDEAIAEFQKALRAPEGRLRTSEALGAAFFDKGQFGIAETVLRRAVDGVEGADDSKIGLLYWLGRAAEEQGKAVDALRCYERTLAVDIRFMDTSDRIHRLSAARQ